MSLLRRFLPLAWTFLFLVLVAAGVLFALRSIYEIPLHGASLRVEREWAAFLLLAAPLWLLVRRRIFRSRVPRLKVGRVSDFSARGRKIALLDCTTGMRATALILIAFALMGPQSIHARDDAEVRGIDILLALDLSLSMQAEDIQPSRFEATQQVVQEFIAKRPNDRIGAVIFGRDAYTLLPLTTDKAALSGTIDELELGAINGRGTAIGNALGTALNRLRDSDAKSKVIVLLTDGDSNAGNVTPTEAASLASAMEVEVHAILMGESGRARVRRGQGLVGPIFDVGDFPVNPELLQSIAEQTGGGFYRAADRRELFERMHTILDSLERSQIDDPGHVYGELFPAFLWPALGLLVFELLISTFWLRRWP